MKYNAIETPIATLPGH